MNKILNFFVVFGVLALCMKYYFNDNISLEVAVVLLIGSVILATIEKPIWKFIKASVAIVSFGLLMVGYAYNMNDFTSILQHISVLLVLLYGFYLIFRGVFRNSSINEEHFTYNKKTGKLKKKFSWW